MSVGAVGRNDPCPCGSGKKYKKCCRGQAHAHLRWGRVESDVAERLDALSNAAADAIEAGRHEEAETLCGRLLRDFPDLVDGHDRLATLREAQKRYREAADHYARAMEVVERCRDDYDPEVGALFEEKRRQALAKATAQT